ncbi:MAG: lysophospholipase [Chloroflexi bacterium]|nr:lysophospholipase [Chloroflexota bacterium]
MQQIEGKFRGAGDLALYYQTWQPATAARGVILLVLGFGEHSGRYNYLIEHLVPQGYIIHAFDLRGHGRSPGARGHINDWQELCDDLRAFMATIVRAEATEPSLPHFLFGHSFGGLIALNYALQYPDNLQGVVVSAPLLAQAKISPFLILLSRLLQRVKPDFAVNVKMDATTISRDPAEVQRYTKDPLIHSIGTPRTAHQIEKAAFWTLANATRWRLPLMLYHGNADRLVPITGSRQFYAQVTFPDKHWIEYEGGYHESHNDRDRTTLFGDLSTWLEAHL